MDIAINARFLALKRLEGIGHYTHEIVSRIVRDHSECKIHLLYDRKCQPLIDAENVFHYTVGQPARHPILWYKWFEWDIPRLLKQIKADVFFSPEGFLSLRTDTPSVMTIHDLAYMTYPKHNKWSHRTYFSHFTPRYINKADHIIAVSQSTKREIIANYKTQEDKISVIYNGVNSAFKPLSPDIKDKIKLEYTEGQDYFLCLGALHPRKNSIRVIQAFEDFKLKTNSKMKLVLAGRWAWKTQKIKQALSRSRVASEIIHLHQFDKIIYRLVGSASALIYVSLLEGFGLPILEAMRSGVPVICSNRGAIREVAQNAAILVRPEDYKEISSAMKEIIGSAELRSQKIEHGLRRSECFDWDEAADSVFKVLQRFSSSANK